MSEDAARRVPGKAFATAVAVAFSVTSSGGFAKKGGWAIRPTW
jgi:hypothetical protein